MLNGLGFARDFARTIVQLATKKATGMVCSRGL